MRNRQLQLSPKVDTTVTVNLGDAGKLRVETGCEDARICSKGYGPRGRKNPFWPSIPIRGMQCLSDHCRFRPWTAGGWQLPMGPHHDTLTL